MLTIERRRHVASKNDLLFTYSSDMSVIHDNEMHALSEECRSTMDSAYVIAMHWAEV